MEITYACSPRWCLSGWMDFIQIQYSRVYPSRGDALWPWTILGLKIGALQMRTKNKAVVFSKMATAVLIGHIISKAFESFFHNPV
jgi:hypothetical protein